MKAQIFINRHIIASNKKTTKETGVLVDQAAVTIKTYKGSIRAKNVEFNAGCRLIQDAESAICSGATIWMEVDDVETLTIDGQEARVAMQAVGWI